MLSCPGGRQTTPQRPGGFDVDPKRFTPRAIKRQISDAKNALMDAEAYKGQLDQG